MKQSTIKDKMSAMLQNRRFRRRWTTLLLAMGGVVVLGTAYVLSMPAITLENSAADSYGVGEEPVELGPDAASPSEASGAYMADNTEGSADASLSSPSELASPSTPRRRRSVSSYDFSDCALLAEGVWENPAEPESQITYTVYKDPYDRILLDIAGQGATPDMTSTDTPPWETQFPGSTINAVYVEDGITRLGDFFMKDASAMEEMYLPETLSELGNHCFELAPSLAELILPSGLESVGEHCFYNNKSGMQFSAYLTRKLILPEGLRMIGNNSFNFFPNLEMLVLPSSLESIGTGFLPVYLNNVKEFTVPENLSFTYPEQAILFGSFEGVMKLPAQGPEDYWKYFRFAKPSRFEVAPGNEAYRTLDNGRLLCHVEENPEEPVNPILRLIGIAKSESGLVEIPEEVNALSNDLLKGRTDIKVLKIQNQAIDYPASLPESNAFGYLSPEFGSSDKRILLGSLREAYIGGSMIPPYAFYKNSTVETIQLTGEVSEIGTQAFNRTDGLKRLVFAHPESVTAIRKGAFNFYNRTTGMEDILRGLNKLTTIEESSFSSVNFAELTIPESVTKLGSDTSSDRAFGQGVRVDTLYYRARDLQTMGYAYSLLSQAPAKMVIGREVKRIVGAGSSGIASRIAAGVKSVSFEGPNTIEIGTQSGDRGLDLPGSPISSLPTGLKLKGTFIVGADGALYQKQAGSSTVTLVRVPENAGRDSGGGYEVPAAIQDENGVSYTVGGIGNYAFAPAPALRELTIAGDAVSGLALSDYSFSGNPSLALINGRTSIRELRPLFGVEGRLPDLFKGSGLSVGFVDSGREVNTPITKIIRSADGKASLTLTQEPSTQGTHAKSAHAGEAEGAYPNLHQDELGYYRYTGEAQTVNITLSGASQDFSGMSCRIYVEFKDEKGAPTQAPGNYSFSDGTPYSLKKYGEGNLYYYEFAGPKEGETRSLPVVFNYASPNTAGGYASIWTDMRPSGNFDGPVSRGDYHRLYWDTTRKEFDVALTRKEPAYSWQSQYFELVYGPKPNELYPTTEVGRDYVREVDYKLSFSPQEGAYWTPRLEEAIRAGRVSVSKSGVSYYDENGNSIFNNQNNTLLSNLPENGRDFKVYWDEEKGPVVTWKIVNSASSTSSPTQEVASVKTNMTMGSGVLMSRDNTDTVGLKVNVETTTKYMYSADAVDTAEAGMTVQAAKARLEVKKEVTQAASYWGEPLSYRVSVQNTGDAAWDGLTALTDELNAFLHIEPEDMERMLFELPYGEGLHIRIKAPQFDKPVNNSAAAVNGDTLQLSARNTGPSTKNEFVQETTDNDPNPQMSQSYKNELYIDVSREGDGIRLDWKINRSWTSPQTALLSRGQLRAKLDEIGYIPLDTDTYQLSWNLQTAETDANGVQTLKKRLIQPGERLEFQIPARMTDSFMRLRKDYPGQAPMPASSVTNSAQAISYLGQNSSSVTSASNTVNVPFIEKEYRIGQVLRKNGVVIGGDTYTVKEGDRLEYKDIIVHRGQGSRDVLPVVTRITGAQRLLVPVAGNEALAGERLEKTEDGVYYILDAENKTYRNIRVGGALADTVSVSRDRGTEINWYYKDFGGDRTVTHSYETVVKPSVLGQNGSLQARTWLNDHQPYRLFAESGTGTVLTFAKDIVLEQGETPAQDTLAPEKFSMIKEGDKVRYRFRLTNNNNFPLTLNNTEIFDYLPKSAYPFVWATADISELSFYAEEGIATVDTAALQHYRVSAEKPDGTGSSATGVQYLVWDSDFKVEFQRGGDAYIYLTLQYPKGDKWGSFVKANQSNRIQNTLSVYRMLDSVYHKTLDPAEGALQKLVYASGWGKDFDGDGRADVNSNFWYSGERQRQLYAYGGRYAVEGRVAYFAYLYNSGYTKLYLNTIEDILPPGFRFLQSITSNNLFDYNPNPYNGSTFKLGATDAFNNPSRVTLADVSGGTSYLLEQNAFGSYSVRTEMRDGREHVYFDLKGDEYSWDSEAQKYYLSPGRGLLFGYICKVDKSTEQGLDSNLRTNWIGMPVDMPDNMLPRIYDKIKATADSRKDGGYTGDSYQNRGSILGISGAEAGELGFAGATGNAGTAEKPYLASSLTVERREMVPGIKKSIESIEHNTGETVDSGTGIVRPSDIIHFKLELYNDGSTPLEDYRITDRIEAPYGFSGNIQAKLVLEGDNSNGGEQYLPALFTLSRENEKDSVSVNSGAVTAIPTAKSDALKATSEEYEAGKVSQPATLYLWRDGSREVKPSTLRAEYLELDFADPVYAIPLNGKLVIRYSVLAPTAQEFTGNYLNTARLYTSQSFNEALVTKGSAGKDNPAAENTPYNQYVESSVPIPVLGDSATESRKRIEESGKSGNAAEDSGTPNNYIIVPGAQKELMYTLRVTNRSELPMEKLVLIDNLPAVGDRYTMGEDTARESQFAVRLTDNPEFELSVTREDGSSSVIPETQYTIEKADFEPSASGEYFAEADWQGKAGSGWSALTPGSYAGTWAFRLILTDSTKTLLPPKATVSLRFKAKPDDAAKPGQKAWNSFGYDYAMADIPGELRAAPLKVGVGIPSYPSLKKELWKGEAEQSEAYRAADRTQNFQFLLYSGAQLGLTGSETEEQLSRRLEDEGRAYALINVTYPQSAALSLEQLKQWRYEAATARLAEGSEAFLWSLGETYTLLEREPGLTDISYESINHQAGREYSFQWTGESGQLLSVRNRVNEWGLVVRKVDKENPGTRLEGAWFGIYGRETNPLSKENGGRRLELEAEARSASGMNFKEFMKARYEVELPEEITVGSETLGLKELFSIDEAEKDTGHRILGLTDGEYYLLELKAPSGYIADGRRLVSRPAAGSDVTELELNVPNARMPRMPATGGAGSEVYTAAGALLVGAAGLLWLKKRREERQPVAE